MIWVCPAVKANRRRNGVPRTENVSEKWTNTNRMTRIARIVLHGEPCQKRKSKPTENEMDCLERKMF